MKLSPKHRLFVKEYLKDKNATRSYRAVYGVKQSVAEANGPRLLGNARVSEAIEKGLARQEEQLGISAERVIANLSAFANLKLTEKERKTSAGSNAIKANEILAKHFKLLTDVHEVSGKDGLPLVSVTMPANGSETKPEGDSKE